MADIFLIRHGQASFGSDNYDQLSELGYRQGRLVGEHFLRAETEFSQLQAGSLARQQQTAEALRDVYRQGGAAIPALDIVPGWDEFDNQAQVELLLPQVLNREPELAPLADNIQRDKKAFQKILRAVFNYWISEQLEHPLLESWPEARQRFDGALDQLMASNGSGQSAAVFTSGGVIAAVTARVMKLGPEAVYGLFEPVINASITRYIHGRSSISLASFNEHRYLFEGEGEGSMISYR